MFQCLATGCEMRELFSNKQNLTRHKKAFHPEVITAKVNSKYVFVNVITNNFSFGLDSGSRQIK